MSAGQAEGSVEVSWDLEVPRSSLSSVATIKENKKTPGRNLQKIELETKTLILQLISGVFPPAISSLGPSLFLKDRKKMKAGPAITEDSTPLSSAVP